MIMSDMAIVHVVYHSPAILFALVALSILPAIRHRLSNGHKSFMALGSFNPFTTLFTGVACFSSMLFRPLRRHNPLIPPTPSKSLWTNRGYLEKLPQRNGSRPEVSVVKPQSRLNQLSSTELYSAISAHIRGIATAYDQSTYLGRSTFTQNSATLYSRSRNFGKTHYHGEICRANLTDGSVHVTLHPADIATVITNGWGERHPDACSGRRRLGLLAPKVSSGYTVIYAPTNEAELEVCREIVKAAVWWVGGIDSRRADATWT